MEEFGSDGVKFVIGHYNSDVSIAASDVYAKSGILMVSPASTNPYFTDRPKPLWNTFRTCGRDDRQGGCAGAYIAEKFKAAKIAPLKLGISSARRICSSKFGRSCRDRRSDL